MNMKALNRVGKISASLPGFLVLEFGIFFLRSPNQKFTLKICLSSFYREHHRTFKKMIDSRA